MPEENKDRLLILHDDNDISPVLEDLSDNFHIDKLNIQRAGGLTVKNQDPAILLFYVENLNESFILQAGRIIKQLKFPSVLLIGSAPDLKILEKATGLSFSFIIYPPYSSHTVLMTLRRLSEFIALVESIGTHEPPVKTKDLIGTPVLDHLKNRTQSLFREIETSMEFRKELKEKSDKLAQQVREMSSILQITTLSEKQDLSLEKFMQESLRMVISAFAEPKQCTGVIRFRNLEVTHGQHKKNRTGLKRQLFHEDNPIGEIEITNPGLSGKDQYHAEEKSLMIVASKYIGQLLLRKESENELLKFKELVEQSPNVIIITDEQGVIEYVNPAFTAIFGYVPKDLTGKFFEFAVRSVDNDKVYQQLTEKLNNKETWSGEIKALKKNGQEFWTHSTISPVIKKGSVINFVAQIVDIDESRKLACELENSRRDLELITSNSPNGILILNLDMEIIFANSKSAEMLETTVEELIAKNPLIFVTADDRDPLASRFRNRLQNKNVSPSIEFRALTAKKNVKDFQIMTSRTTWKGKDAFLYNIIDISAGKRMSRWLEYELRIHRLIGEDKPREDLLQEIFRLLYNIDWIDCGGIYLRDEENQGIELIFSDNLSQDFVSKVRYYKIDSPQFQALLKKAALFLDAGSLPEDQSKLYKDEGLLSVVALPLLHKNQPIGVMNLGSRSIRNIPEDDKSMLFNIAQSLAYLLSR